MKKILLATTILASFAGYAAADVSVSGDARMGLVNDGGDTAFSSRMRIKFSGSGTTDHGLSFGGSFRANDAAGANSGTSGSVFIKGAFGAITMGDVDSGDAAAVGQLASVGYTGLDSGNSINYVADGYDMRGLTAAVTSSYSESGDGYSLSDYGHNFYNYDFEGTHDVTATVVDGAKAKVLYSYSDGALTIDASASQPSSGGSPASYGLGVAYTSGDLTLAGGYGRNEFQVSSESTFSGVINDPNPSDFSVTDWTYTGDGTVTDLSASASYVMGDTSIKAIYQDKQAEIAMTWDWDNSTDHLSTSETSYGLSVTHKIDALTMTAYAVTTALTDGITVNIGEQGWPTQTVNLNRYGLGASYDLGGSASLSGGVVRLETPALSFETDYYGYDNVVTGIHKDAVTKFDLGLTFSF